MFLAELLFARLLEAPQARNEFRCIPSLFGGDCFLIYLILGEFVKHLVGGFLFVKGLLQKIDRIIVLQLACPGPKSTVPCYFIMFESLGCADQACMAG